MEISKDKTSEKFLFHCAAWWAIRILGVTRWLYLQTQCLGNVQANRVTVQGVKSLGGHFVCLCRGFEFYEVKKENGNTFKLFIIFIVKSLQKEQNSTNLLLWPPICRNKPEITPK